jgi:hypothetical protein
MNEKNCSKYKHFLVAMPLTRRIFYMCHIKQQYMTGADPGGGVVGATGARPPKIGTKYDFLA